MDSSGAVYSLSLERSARKAAVKHLVMLIEDWTLKWTLMHSWSLKPVM